MLRHALQVVASASDRTIVRSGRFRMTFAEMNTHQAELVAQIEVIVHDNPAAILFRHKAQQSLAEDGLWIGFAKVKDVQPFLEKRGQDLVLFDEELGAGEQNKFHSFLVVFLFLSAKVQNLVYSS